MCVCVGGGGGGVGGCGCVCVGVCVGGCGCGCVCVCVFVCVCTYWMHLPRVWFLRIERLGLVDVLVCVKSHDGACSISWWRVTCK